MDMNYKEAKNKIDKIRQKYGCKGELIFRCAITNVVDCGATELKKQDYLESWLKSIDERHDKAESKDKFLVIGRDFEKAIAECTCELAKVNSMHFIMYIQREIWMYDYPGEIIYDRAISLLQNVIEWNLVDRETEFARDDLSSMGFDDDELINLGYEEVFFVDEIE